MIIQNEGFYSDGLTVEKEMLDIAEKYSEDQAEEYISHSSRYVPNCTFSSVRQNLLNWYPFRNDSTVLEIGAGMGAITGVLCDRCAEVTALEMSPDRAKVIKARYKNRSNLTVYTGLLKNFAPEKKFDYVVIVGVMEYAAVFDESDHPFDNFLNQAKSFMTDNGVLLLAIENRFGLKYWCGASEDHLCQPYVGIRGYGDKKKTPVTFSRQELLHLFGNAGMHTRFYYVLPDYRFPTLIFTDEHKPRYQELRNTFFTYAANSSLTVNERDLYKDILPDDAFGFFANSYLIEASSSLKLPEPHCTFMISHGEIKKEYRVSTLIMSDGSVLKKAMHPKAVQHLRKIKEHEDYLNSRGIPVIRSILKDDTLISAYMNAPSAESVLNDCFAKNDIKRVYELIDKFKASVLKSSPLAHKPDLNIFKRYDIDPPSEEDIGPCLEKGFVDFLFYNAFFKDETFIFYDQEWCLPNLPIKYILYFAIKGAYERKQAQTSITMEQLLEYLGIGKERKAFDLLESRFFSKNLYRQTDLYGEDGLCNQYSAVLTREYQERIEQEQKERYRAWINGLEEEKKEYLAWISSLEKEKKDYIDQIRSLVDKVNEQATQINTLTKQYEAEKRTLTDTLLQTQQQLNLVRRSKGYRLQMKVLKLLRKI